MDIIEIMNYLPHRYPFLLVDKVVDIIDNEKIIAIKNVTMNEPFFQGHFPGHPVMPGVLIIEALAQTGACCILKREEFIGKTAFLGAINKAKFRKQVVPGDTLRLEVTLVNLRNNVGTGMGVAFVGDKKVAEAEIVFVVS